MKFIESRSGGDTHTITWQDDNEGFRHAKYWLFDSKKQQYILWQEQMYRVDLRKNFREDVKKWQRQEKK